MEEKNLVKKEYLLPISILIAAILISGAIIYSANLKTDPTAAQIKKTFEAPVENKNTDFLADDDAVLGDPKAAVTIVEFGDYQCPFCGRFFEQIEPKLKEEYVATGKAKLIYRDFAFLGPESKTAALAAQCAGEQNKYWEFHNRLFEIEIADGSENNGNLSNGLMKSLAKELGLDRGKFNLCFDSQKYREEIEKDYNDGLSAGVSGTPATFINSKLISGVQPYSVFKQAIDKIIYK